MSKGRRAGIDRREMIYPVLGLLALIGSSIAAVVAVIREPSASASGAVNSWFVAVVVGMTVLSFIGSLLVGRAAKSVTATMELSPHERIDRVRRHLADTGLLLSELQDDLATRTRVLEQLQADSERYERLASLNKEQAEAIQDLIGRQFTRQQRTSLWQQGLFLAPAFLLGFVVNWLSGPALQWVGDLF